MGEKHGQIYNMKKSLWLLGTEWLRESGRTMSRLGRCFRQGMTKACFKVLTLDWTNTHFPFLLPDRNAIFVTPLFVPKATSIQLYTK